MQRFRAPFALLLLMTSACQTMQHGHAPVAGGQLYYEVAGTGPAVVFIHAGIANARMWDEQFAAFARHYRVVRYDTRGFGRSRTESVAFSNRQDLADLLRQLGISQAALIGLSRGGNIATDFTLEHPEMVTALVVAGAGIGGFEPPAPPATEAKLFAAMEKAEKTNDVPRIVELDLQVWVDGPGQSPQRVPATLREKVRAMDTPNYARADGAPQPKPLLPPAAGRLAEIRVPTLVLVGDLDTSETQAAADKLAREIPGATKVVFTGAAHMLNMEQPGKFNAIVLEFLQARR